MNKQEFRLRMWLFIIAALACVYLAAAALNWFLDGQFGLDLIDPVMSFFTLLVVIYNLVNIVLRDRQKKPITSIMKGDARQAHIEAYTVKPDQASALVTFVSSNKPTPDDPNDPFPTANITKYLIAYFRPKKLALIWSPESKASAEDIVRFVKSSPELRTWVDIVYDPTDAEKSPVELASLDSIDDNMQSLERAIKATGIRREVVAVDITTGNKLTSVASGIEAFLSGTKPVYTLLNNGKRRVIPQDVDALLKQDKVDAAISGSSITVYGAPWEYKRKSFIAEWFGA